MPTSIRFQNITTILEKIIEHAQQLVCALHVFKEVDVAFINNIKFIFHTLIPNF